MAPDSDEKIHRDQHHLPEEIKQKQIQRQENTDYASQNPEQIEMEKRHSFPNFTPGRHNRYQTQERRQQYHEQTQSVQSQIKVDAILWNPALAIFDQPGATLHQVHLSKMLAPQNQHQHEVDGHSEQRHPSGGQWILAA